MVRPTDRPDAMFLCASFSPSPLHISRDTIRDKGSWTSPKKRGSVVPLSRTRQGKPGFTECWRERRASETADGGEIINGSHHWCFTALLIIHSHFISFIIHWGTLLQSHTLCWSECTVCNCKTDSLTGVEVRPVLQIIISNCACAYTPKCSVGPHCWLIEVGTYISIRRKHSAVKPAITESGRAPRRDLVHVHVHVQDKSQDGSDRDVEVHRIDLLAAPLQHLTVNQQQRLASETTDERAAWLQRDRDNHNNWFHFLYRQANTVVAS